MRKVTQYLLAILTSTVLLTGLCYGDRVVGDQTITGDHTVNGNIITPGTVDGRDVSVDGGKLDGIAAGAEVNPDVISQAEAEAGTATTERIFTAERVKQAIAALGGGGGGDGDLIATANEVDIAGTLADRLVGAGNLTFSLADSVDLSSHTGLAIPASNAPALSLGDGAIGIDLDGNSAFNHLLVLDVGHATLGYHAVISNSFPQNDGEVMKYDQAAKEYLPGFITVAEISDFNVPDPLIEANHNQYLRAIFITPDDYGDGADGVFTGGTTPDPSVYTDLTANAVSTAVITVRDASAFTIGDEVFIHQTQIGTTGALNTRGIFEYNRIVNKTATTITLACFVSNSYQSDSDGNKANNKKAQILKVMNYTDVNLTAGPISAPAWDGFTGGVLVFRVQGTLSGGGNIIMSSKGFRGGLSGNPGTQGEGWEGISSTSGGGGGPGAGDGGGGGHRTAGSGGNGAGGLSYTPLDNADLETNINIGGGSGGAAGVGALASGAILAFVSTFASYSGSVLSTSGGSGPGGAILLYSPSPYAGTVQADSGAFNPGGFGFILQTTPPTAPIARYELGIKIDIATQASNDFLGFDTIVAGEWASTGVDDLPNGAGSLAGGDFFMIGQAGVNKRAAISGLRPILGVDVWPSGVTGSRPGGPVLGQRFFDTTLGFPIWFDATNWVDATGTTQ